MSTLIHPPTNIDLRCSQPWDILLEPWSPFSEFNCLPGNMAYTKFWPDVMVYLLQTFLPEEEQITLAKPGENAHIDCIPAWLIETNDLIHNRGTTFPNKLWVIAYPPLTFANLAWGIPLQPLRDVTEEAWHIENLDHMKQLGLNPYNLLLLWALRANPDIKSRQQVINVLYNHDWSFQLITKVLPQLELKNNISFVTFRVS